MKKFYAGLLILGAANFSLKASQESPPFFLKSNLWTVASSVSGQYGSICSASGNDKYKYIHEKTGMVFDIRAISLKIIANIFGALDTNKETKFHKILPFLDVVILLKSSFSDCEPLKNKSFFKEFYGNFKNVLKFELGNTLLANGLYNGGIYIKRKLI